MQESLVDFLVEKYIQKEQVLGIGTSNEAEKFIKSIALKDLNVKIVPTSTKLAGIIASLGLDVCGISEQEIDVAIEFIDQIDEHFSFIKNNSHSLVRDKMIGQSASELIVVTDEKNFVKRLKGIVPVEITPFGWKRTLIQLENFGNAKLKEESGNPVKTETGNFFVDVNIADIFSLEELEQELKNIPGVLETGLFIGYADRIVLTDGKGIKVKSRMMPDFSKAKT